MCTLDQFYKDEEAMVDKLLKKLRDKAGAGTPIDENGDVADEAEEAPEKKKKKREPEEATRALKN